jgi:hypothetical protein
MDLQSIYFEINLTDNLAVKDAVDVGTLPYERIVGDLFTGSAVLIDRQGCCFMLNGISVSRFIRHLEQLLDETRQWPTSFVVEDDQANYYLELRREKDMLVLCDPAESRDFQLEFDARVFESLFSVKKQNVGMLFWMIYPELLEHREVERLRRFFE